MKVRPPKSYTRLPPSEQKIIEDMLRKQEAIDAKSILDIYMKMVCSILHDAFGFGEYRLNLLLANHFRLIKEQNILVDQGEQIKFLDDKMAKIFRKNGFPQAMMEKAMGTVELVEPQKHTEEGK